MNRIFEHFAFQGPWWLLLLLVLPPLFFLRNAPGAISGLGFPSLSILASVGRAPRERLGRFAPWLLCFALAAAILALARPQWRNEYVARTASGIDILIALDVSESMLIPDFVQPNRPQRLRQRIDAAKEVIESFINQRSDDRFGLVVFATQPLMRSPITLDHDWLIESMKQFQIRDIDANGTAVGSAIAAASTLLTERDAKSKIVVLVTDGESNSGRLGPMQAARLAADLGIRVYTVGIGTDAGRLPGTFLPPRKQEFDPTTLKEIASVTGGEFFLAQDNTGLRNTFDSINKLEKTEVKRHTVVDARELYPWFLGMALVLAFFSLSSTALNPPPVP